VQADHGADAEVVKANAPFPTPVQAAELKNSEAITRERAHPLAVVERRIGKREQPVGRVNHGAEPEARI